MIESTLESCLDAIENVFEQEAEYIVAGNLLEIGELSKTKLEHLNQLSTAIESGALANQPPVLINRVKRVQDTASEHSRHLEAMRHGLNRILSRLGRLQGDTMVGSYDQTGSRVQFSGAIGRFESKA